MSRIDWTQAGEEKTAWFRNFCLGAVLLAAVFETFVLNGAAVWVTPDSSAYLSLAAGIAEHGDFQQPLLQLRLPGYPLLLAGLFKVFGSDAPLALQVVQHAMVVGCVFFSLVTAFTIWPHRLFVLGVALCGIASIHLSGYANAVLTEVPYAFFLSATVCAMVRFLFKGYWRSALAATLCASCAMMIKDIGIYAVLLSCLLTLLAIIVLARETPGIGQKSLLLLRGLGVTLLPAAVIVGPYAYHNLQTLGRWKANANGGLLYYYRAGCLEGLDLEGSDACRHIRETVAQARIEGAIPQDATHHDYLPAVTAFEWKAGHRGSTFESGKLADFAPVFRRAGLDLIRAYPKQIARSAARDAWRIMMIPDDGYRMMPGGELDVGRLDPRDEFHAPTTYEADVRNKVGAKLLDAYMPLTNRPKSGTPAWSAVASAYHRHIERGRSLGIGDSPYEALVLLAIVGGILSILHPHRAAFALVGVIVAYHVCGSAFMGGVQPRYVVPVHPLMHLFVPVVPVGLVSLAAGLFRHKKTEKPQPTAA